MSEALTLAAEIEVAYTENRLGRFAVQETFLRRAPGVVGHLLSRMLVVRAQGARAKKPDGLLDVTVEGNIVVYTAYSIRFEAIPLDKEPLWYPTLLRRNDLGPADQGVVPTSETLHLSNEPARDGEPIDWLA